MATGHIEFEIYADGSADISTYTQRAPGHGYDPTKLVDVENHQLEFSVLCCNDEGYSEITPGCRVRIHILHAETVDADDPRTVCADMEVMLGRGEIVALRDYLTYLLGNPLEID